VTDLSPGGYHGYLLAPSAAHRASSMRQGAQARQNGPRWVQARVRGGEGSRGSVLEFDGSGAVFLPFAGLFGASQLSLTWRARLRCTSETCGTQVMWSMHTLKGWILRAEVTPQSPVSPGSGGEKQEGGDGRGSMHAAVVWVEVVMLRHPFQHVLASLHVPVVVLERAWHTQDTPEGGNAEEAGKLNEWVSFSLSMSSHATEPILFAAWVDDDQAQAEEGGKVSRRSQRGERGHRHPTTRAAGKSAPHSSSSNHRWSSWSSSSSWSSCPSDEHKVTSTSSCRSGLHNQRACDEHTEKASSEHKQTSASAHVEEQAASQPPHSHEDNESEGQASEGGGGGGRGAQAGKWHVDRKQQGRCKQQGCHHDADKEEHCGYSSAMDKTFIYACAPMTAHDEAAGEASGETLKDGQCALFSPNLAHAVAECSRRHRCGGVTFSPRRGVFELRRGPNALTGDSQVEGEVSWVKRGGKCSRHVAVIPPNRCMTYTSPPGGKRRCNRWGAYLPFNFETGCSTRAFLVDETGRPMRRERAVEEASVAGDTVYRDSRGQLWSSTEGATPADKPLFAPVAAAADGGGAQGSVNAPKAPSPDLRARFQEVNWIVSLKGCSNDFWVLALDGIAGIWLGSTDGDELDTLSNRSAVDSLAVWNAYWSLDSLSQARPPHATHTHTDTDTETGQDTEGRQDADAMRAGDERVHGEEGSGVPGVHNGHSQHQTPAEDVSGGAHQGRREEGVDGDGSEARVGGGEAATQGHGGAGGSRHPGEEALGHLKDLRAVWQRESDVSRLLLAAQVPLYPFLCLLPQDFRLSHSFF
jgi:hypothetical protein